jgi:transposase
MCTPTLLPDPTLVAVDYVSATDDTITLVAVTVQPRPRCPDCACPAERIHSRYFRTLADEPWKGLRVRLRLASRKWFCDRPDCSRGIFTERLPALTSPWSRRTDRLTAVLRDLAYALGGEPGARFAGRLGVAISPDTLLRVVQQRGGRNGAGPRVLGVDDFAFRKGRAYGTLLMDLETGEPVDLLPDRRAESLAQWLKKHPGVEVISRDRGGSYAEGARQGAPDAQQVADRWHLLKNLTEALEAALAAEQQAFREAAAPEGTAEAAMVMEAGASDPPTDAAPTIPVPTTQAARESVARRERRLGRYEEVRRLYQQGHTQRAIAIRLGLSRKTVRTYLTAAAFPEQKKRRVAPGQIVPFLDFLRRRWREGCHNATQLWRELQAQGFQGGRTTVLSVVSAWRAELPPEERRTSGRAPGRRPSTRVPAPRAVVWFLLRQPEERTAEESRFAERLLELRPELALARDLVQEFFGFTRRRDASVLEAWLARAEASGIAALKGFCSGVRRDWDAVLAGLTLEWSNGPVEGHVNRLKAIKRQMYGRAGFDLLKARVLRPG